MVNTVQEASDNSKTRSQRAKNNRDSTASIITKPTGFIQETIMVPDVLCVAPRDVKSESEQFICGLGSNTRDRLKATSTPNDDVSVRDVFNQIHE